MSRRRRIAGMRGAGRQPEQRAVTLLHRRDDRPGLAVADDARAAGQKEQRRRRRTGSRRSDPRAGAAPPRSAPRRSRARSEAKRVRGRAAAAASGRLGQPGHELHEAVERRPPARQRAALSRLVLQHLVEVEQRDGRAVRVDLQRPPLPRRRRRPSRRSSSPCRRASAAARPPSAKCGSPVLDG